MFQASLYSKYNDLPKYDAKFVIENYLRLLTWQENENILVDVGSGDGGVTFDVLLPKLPKNFNQFVATDISEEMIEFAKNKYKHPKIRFARLDITSNDIPAEFHENFNHIFSFYCLHWVSEQRKAFKNMFDMLKPGGVMLITFLVSHPIFDIYENIAKLKKWTPYTQNFQQFVAPYQHTNDPGMQLEKLLKDGGFISHLCRIESRSYTFPNVSVFIKSVSAVDPFIKNLPETEIDNYFDDYIKEIRKLDCVTIETCNNNSNIEEKITISYKLFVIVASKSL